VQPHLAGYRLGQPIERSTRAESRLAEPPARLDWAGPVVVTEVTGLSEADWPAVLARLRDLAGVSSPHLSTLLEAGRHPDAGSGTPPEGGSGHEPPSGGSLTVWTARSRGTARPLGSGEERASVLRALAGAARGAAALHDAGRVHGAITPATVLVDGELGVLDSPCGATLAGPPLMAAPARPADLDGVEAACLWGAGPSPGSDVFALGAAAHVLLGWGLLHPRLSDDDPVTAVQRVLVEPPALAAGLEPDLARLLGACLARDPADRPSAAELAGRLQEAA